VKFLYHVADIANILVHQNARSASGACSENEVASIPIDVLVVLPSVCVLAQHQAPHSDNETGLREVTLQEWGVPPRPGSRRWASSQLKCSRVFTPSPEIRPKPKQPRKGVSLQKSRPRMILEQLSVANVAA
jgi:hypothetical protein